MIILILLTLNFTIMDYSSLDIYNAMCDAENGFDSGALDRLTGRNYLDEMEDDDYDDLYTPEELRARGLIHDDDDD